MRTVTGAAADWGLERVPRAITVGVFDGVHPGHQHLLDLVLLAAADLGGVPAAVLTVDPHPLVVVAPDRAPRMLTDMEHRLELFASAGMDLTAVLRFDQSVRDLEPEAFAADIMAAALGATVVVVGEDFHFGRNRSGDVELLAALGETLGFSIRVVPLVGDEQPISSSRIRAMVAAGDVAAAASALGRPHEVRGLVVRGEGRGRSIGVPTANVVVAGHIAVPARGVYAVRAGRVGEPLLPGVANIGVRPTFGGGEEILEVHLFDVVSDLYDARMRVSFVGRLRAEQRFAGVEDLVAQIGRDAVAARCLLGA